MLEGELKSAHSSATQCCTRKSCSGSTACRCRRRPHERQRKIAVARPSTASCMVLCSATGPPQGNLICAGSRLSGLLTRPQQIPPQGCKPAQHGTLRYTARTAGRPRRRPSRMRRRRRPRSRRPASWARRRRLRLRRPHALRTRPLRWRAARASCATTRSAWLCPLRKPNWWRISCS